MQGKNVSVIYYYIINYPKILLTQNNIYDLTVFVGEESGHGLAGSFGSGSIPKLQFRCQRGLWSHFKAQLGKDLLPSSLIGCWQDPVCQGLLD